MPAYGVDNGVHPDHHAWWIHPTNGKFMLDGNDGGLNLTRDGGQSWRFMGNIPVGQFYHIAADMDVPYNVYGGMQDNGSWRGPAYVWKRQGIRNSYWQEISFGDGFEQRYTEGLNQNPITLNLVFEVNQSEANTAIEFLDDQIKNGTSFNYRLPNESVTRKYVCESYPRTIPFLDRIRLSCVFRQVFEP